MAGGVPDSSPMEEAEEVAHGLAGVLGVLGGRAGALRLGLGLLLRMMGLLG